MPPELSQNTTHPDLDEFEKFWGLHEPLRLPSGRTGWETFEPLPILDEMRFRVPTNNYASVVGVPSKQETLRKVAMLIDEFPLDFKVAAESISPAGWRTLYYSACYNLSRIGSYNFHAHQELRHICEFDEFTEGLPAVWIGSDVEPRIVAQQTREVLETLGQEPSKAVYCVLAAAQRVSLSRPEIRWCEWWSAAWIQNLSARLNAAQ
jgi:hypothetical protein